MHPDKRRSVKRHSESTSGSPPSRGKKAGTQHPNRSFSYCHSNSSRKRNDNIISAPILDKKPTHDDDVKDNTCTSEKKNIIIGSTEYNIPTYNITEYNIPTYTTEVEDISVQDENIMGVTYSNILKSSTDDIFRDSIIHFSRLKRAMEDMPSTTFDVNDNFYDFTGNISGNIHKIHSSPSIIITEDFPDPSLLRKGDTYLTSIFISGGFWGEKLRLLNEISRMSLQAITIADIATADGRSIRHSAVLLQHSNGLRTKYD